MTIAEQLEQTQRGDKYRSLGAYVLGFLALVVPIMAMFLVFNISKTAEVANTVDRELQNARVAICNSRVTTLRTAPQTVKEYRAVLDAESKDARRVCPDLDYADLKQRRIDEVALLDAGADVNAVAVR